MFSANTFTSTFVGYSFAFPGVAAYAASKSGLIGLTQALAAEFGPRGVRVNAILPGAVETGMYREMNDTADKQAFMTNLHALRRVSQPEELARSVLYLASDDSAFVTGTASLVDGGASDHPELSLCPQLIPVASGVACSSPNSVCSSRPFVGRRNKEVLRGKSRNSTLRAVSKSPYRGRRGIRKAGRTPIHTMRGPRPERVTGRVAASARAPNDREPRSPLRAGAGSIGQYMN
jgi:hypothetical protein